MSHVFIWHRGDKDIHMYFKGYWTRDCKDGRKGDVRGRPIFLGDGPFTITVAPSDCSGLPSNEQGE
jgi:hypothetical protein